MNQLILPFSLLLSVFHYVEAQSSSDQIPSFQPSIVAVLGVLIVIFFLTILLSIYAIWCRGTSAADNDEPTPEELEESTIPRSSGVDRIVIESLPFFKFSALRGLRGGLECAVCLSKFEDIEVLRLLPKCKHAFHINCVDKWLESHSSCPLCRQRIGVEDLTRSNSWGFLSSKSEAREGSSNLELFVQREDSRRQGSSSVLSFGTSLRKSEKGVVKEDELPIREACDSHEENDKFLHRFNHKIIMSDSLLKSRWSNLSSSDLLFLNSEMLGDLSINRFPLFDSNRQENCTTHATKEGEISKISDGMGLKRDFKTKFCNLNQNDSYPLASGADSSNQARNLLPNENRSMSEIVVHSRLNELDSECSVSKNAAKEERLKRLWLQIARKTVQWYANRDSRYRQSNYRRQSLNL